MKKKSKLFMQPPKFLFLFIFLTLLSCNPKIAKKSESIIDQKTISALDIKTPSPAEPTKIIQALPVNNTVVSLKRTPCYGKCPVFEIKFSKSQYVFWRGYANVDKIGYFEAPIEGKLLKEIKLKAAEAGLYNMNNSYPIAGEFLDDYPSVITHVFDDSREKRIINIYDAPRELVDFENFLLEITKKLNWTEIDEVD